MGAILGSYVSVASTSPAFPGQFVDGFQAALHVAAGIAYGARVSLTIGVASTLGSRWSRWPIGSSSSITDGSSRKAHPRT